MMYKDEFKLIKAGSPLAVKPEFPCCFKSSAGFPAPAPCSRRRRGSRRANQRALTMPAPLRKGCAMLRELPLRHGAGLFLLH